MRAVRQGWRRALRQGPPRPPAAQVGRARAGARCGAEASGAGARRCKDRTIAAPTARRIFAELAGALSRAADSFPLPLPAAGWRLSGFSACMAVHALLQARAARRRSLARQRPAPSQAAPVQALGPRRSCACTACAGCMRRHAVVARRVRGLVQRTHCALAASPQSCTMWCSRSSGSGEQGGSRRCSACEVVPACLPAEPGAARRSRRAWAR